MSKGDAPTERELTEKAEGRAQLKNQNPNEQHNSKKVSLGPNTKR